MGMDPITATVLGGILVGTTVEQREQTRAARRDARRAQATERRIQNVRAARERRRMAREARTARAQIESGAVASGTQNTSSAISGAAGVTTQLASNLSFLEQQRSLTNTQSLFAQKAADHTSKAQEMAGYRTATIQTASLFLPG